MLSSTFTAFVLLAAAPGVLAQNQRSSITSAPSMAPMPTPSRGPVTMEWNTEPVAALSASTSTRSRASSATREALMTMSDGTVMSMPSGAAMGGMGGMSGTGTLNFTGSAGRVELGGGAWSVGMGLISLGAGVGFLAGAL